MSEDAYLDHFDEFAVQLVTALELIFDVCPMSGTAKAVAAQRERLWKVFHEKRTELPEMWKHFLQTVDNNLDTLVYLRVNQKLFEEVNFVCNQGNHPLLFLLMMRSVLFDTHQDIFLLS